MNNTHTEFSSVCVHLEVRTRIDSASLLNGDSKFIFLTFDARALRCRNTNLKCNKNVCVLCAPCLVNTNARFRLLIVWLREWKRLKIMSYRVLFNGMMISGGAHCAVIDVWSLVCLVNNPFWNYGFIITTFSSSDNTFFVFIIYQST